MQTCPKCGDTHFYEGRNGRRICKYCTINSTYIDLDNPHNTPEPFMALNIPIINNQWHKLVSKYKEEAHNLNLIFGRYVAIMKLKAYCNFRYKDSDWININSVEYKGLTEL